MSSMLCDVWQDFCYWIVNDWTDTAFYAVVSILTICGLLIFVSFLKSTYSNGDIKFKWGSFIFMLVIFAVVAVLCVAKFA